MNLDEFLRDDEPGRAGEQPEPDRGAGHVHSAGRMELTVHGSLYTINLDVLTKV